MAGVCNPPIWPTLESSDEHPMVSHVQRGAVPLSTWERPNREMVSWDTYSRSDNLDFVLCVKLEKYGSQVILYGLLTPQAYMTLTLRF